MSMSWDKSWGYSFGAVACVLFGVTAEAAATKNADDAFILGTLAASSLLISKRYFDTADKQEIIEAIEINAIRGIEINSKRGASLIENALRPENKAKPAAEVKPEF